MKTQPITTPKIAYLLGGFSNDNESEQNLPAGWVSRIVREVQKDECGYLCGATKMQRIVASIDDDLLKQASMWAADTAMAIVKAEEPEVRPTLANIMDAAQILRDYYWFEHGIPQPQVG